MEGFRVSKVSVHKPEASWPDIDSDFSTHPVTGKGKDDIVSYLISKYGERFVAYVGNRLEYQPKSVLRDLGQVYEIPSQDTMACTKEYNDELSVEENVGASEAVRAYFERYPQIADKLERIVGATSSLGVHAGGVVVSNASWPLDMVCPLQRTKEDGKVATVWTKDEIQKVGLIKYDILGVSSIAQIHYARELLGLDPYDDAPEDEAVFRDVVLGVKNRNVFQFESEIGRMAFTDLMPMSILELANASGIIRVLGSESGRALYEEYMAIVERKQREGDVSFWREKVIEETVEPHVRDAALRSLAETYGVLIYQEQLAYFIHYVSGGQKTFAEGNVCRKKLEKFSKKYGTIDDVQGKPAALREWHAEFMKIVGEYVMPYLGRDGAQSTDETVRNFLKCRLDQEGRLPIPPFGVFKWLVGSAAYLFNKLHAVAYSVNSYNMMWLKYYAPLQFWLSSLLCEQGDTAKVRSYVAAIKAENPEIAILGPDVNMSDAGFKIEGDGIRFGLGAISGVGKAAEAIMRARASGPFKSFEDFEARVERRVVNRGVINKLFFLGAFDSIESKPETAWKAFESVANKVTKNSKAAEEERKDLISVWEAARGGSSAEAAVLESSLIGANIAYEHPVVSQASAYVPLDAFEDGMSDVVAVKIVKAESRVTKNNKPYKMYSVSCLNCDKAVNLFDWQNRDDVKANDFMILRVKFENKFWSLCGPSKNAMSAAAIRAKIHRRSY